MTLREETIKLGEEWQEIKRECCRAFAPKWLCKICSNLKCKKENDN